jgi:CRP-like cAMP-binding protein
MQTSNQTYDVIIKEYAPGETIVSEGTSKECFYVILSGSVEISQNRKKIRTLRDGDVFGAENYYRKQAYNTTATAITPARVAKYRSEIIHDIFYTNPLMAEQIFTSSIRQLEQTTSKAKENAAYEIPCAVREQVYQDSEIIFKENTMGNELFCLREAQHGLQVSIQGRDVRTITRLGEIFGVSSSLLRQPRSATVSSIGRSRIQIFTVENLEEDFKNYPGLAMAIINSLTNRMREKGQCPAEQGHSQSDTGNKPGNAF